MNLTPTQRGILTAAAQRPDHLAYPPERLPAAARQAVAKALIKIDLVVAITSVVNSSANWSLDGDHVLLKITDDGLRAIGIDPNADDEQGPAAIARRNAERLAAQGAHAAPTAGDADAAGESPAAVAEPGAPRKQREGTKREDVLAMLRRPEGATVAQIAEATGWAAHSVRGFFAGLKKRDGIEVKVLERVRQVGPNKTGAKGSFTVYQVEG